MNFKFLFCLLFLYQLTSQTKAFRTTGFVTEIDFSNYINKSEKDLIDDTNVNWVRTDYKNAYKCQGQQIKKEEHLFRLLPRNGKFMATYIYSRPSLKELMGDLITYALRSESRNAQVFFKYSQDKNTILRIYLWRKINQKYDENQKYAEPIWMNEANDHPTNGVVEGQTFLRNLNDEFRLIFQAEVSADYQFTFRTYLSQVVLDKVKISF